MATGLLESMDYKGGGLLERTHCTGTVHHCICVLNSQKYEAESYQY